MYLGIIPARKGSKGIPGKNVVKLGKKPLISWTIESALKVNELDDIVVTSDYEDVLRIGNSYGLKCIERPSHFAKDESQIIDTVKHVLNNYKGKTVTHIVLLQPTSPFRKEKSISSCINLSKKEKCDTVITGYANTHYHPSLIFKIGAEKNEVEWLFNSEVTKRRQDYSKFMVRSGVCYVSSAETILEKSSLYGESILCQEVSLIESLNIDHPDDLELAKYYLERMKEKL